MKWRLNLFGNVWNQQREADTTLGKWKTIVYDFTFFTPRDLGIIVKNHVSKPVNDRRDQYGLWMGLPPGKLRLSLLSCPSREAYHSAKLLLSDLSAILGHVRCISHRIASGPSEGIQKVPLGLGVGVGVMT